MYIDNIRWLMIIFVVVMHLNVTYSNMGLWYYMEPSKTDRISTLIFAVYGFFTQAYFMGLLFFIAGYFLPGSYDKKGTVIFIRDRLFRLGIPILVYMLLIHPLTIMIIGAYNPINAVGFRAWYIEYLSSFTFLSTSGPLWFAVALLIFSGFYALLRSVFFRQANVVKNIKPVLITHTRVLMFIAIISIMAFLIRVVCPSGVTLFNNKMGNFMQLGNFSSYIVLFILGIVAYRRKLLDSVTYDFGKVWFKLSSILGFPLCFIILILGGAAENPRTLLGGFYWQSMAFSIWESFFCVGICLGLLAIFRERFNTQGRLGRFLSANAFGVYVFHAPILVGITLLFRNIVIAPGLKMFLMAGIVLPVCFVCSYLLRKVPIIRKIIY
ncbi:acyltransferase family protein [Clostridium beijerinckii]|uniref:acyltransferase family protein n=1 Tax=Clostridium beijerinckii TaxID=1520 RepID=UPI00098BD125|nr:acyltransferase family protein [Clostridium beijerinckii]